MNYQLELLTYLNKIYDKKIEDVLIKEDIDKLENLNLNEIKSLIKSKEIITKEFLGENTLKSVIRELVNNLDYFYGEHVVYLVLEFANKKLPEGIGFKQKFSASLIQKEVYDVILVPRNAVESTVWNEYYVYRISSDDT